MPRIVPLQEAPPHEIEQLLDRAFGTDRHGRTAYRLRAGMTAIPSLSLAALDEQGRVVGSLQSWPIALHANGESPVPLVLVGPVAVAPDRQRGGLGRQMMEAMLARADQDGAEPQILIGDPEYYGRFFGFTADATGEWHLPGPFERRRLLARTGNRPLPRTGTLGPGGMARTVDSPGRPC